MNKPTPCHCGAAEGFVHCCGIYLTGAATPGTAEQLMRSRYSAFVERDAKYLLATWHPETRPSRVRFDEAQRWLGLAIKRCERGCAGDATGVVEFVARYKIAGKGYRMHEVSRFEKLQGHWFYRDGDHL